MKKLLQMIVRWLKMTFSFNVKGLTPQDVNTGGGGGETPTGGVFPKNIAGLVMFLDGEINSRDGAHNESVNGMQNLVYSPVFGHNSLGYKEVLNGTPTFDSKGCILGGTCFYPDYANDEMTIEFCVVQTQSLENQPLHQQFIIHGFKGNEGYQIWLSDNSFDDVSLKNVVTFQACNSSGPQSKDISAKFTQTYGEKIYYAMTTKFSDANSTKVYMNGVLVTELVNNYDGVSLAGTNSGVINVGLGGLCSANTTSSTPTSSNKFPAGAFYAPYLKWYSFRKWSRRLTPDEIKQNYLQDKKRFG